VSQLFLRCSGFKKHLGEFQLRGLHAIEERCKRKKRVHERVVVKPGAADGGRFHRIDCLYGQINGGKEL